MIPDLLPVALDFYKDPRRHPGFRDARVPLPPGITALLDSSGDALAAENIDSTAEALGSTPSELNDALRFFVKEVFLRSGGDSYRVLGLMPGADGALVKKHYRQLITLFHPDKDTSGEGWDTLYAPVINEAYGNLRQQLRRGDSAGADDVTGASGDTETIDPLRAHVQQLATASKSAGAPSARSPSGDDRAPKSKSGALGTLKTSSVWRQPWLYGGLAGAALLVLVILIATRDHAPPVKMTAPSVVQNSLPDHARPDLGALQESVANGPRDVSGDESSAASASNSATASTSGNSGISKTDAPNANPYRVDEDEAERRVEQRIKEKLARATRSVLGSSTRPKPAPKKTVTSTSTSSAKTSSAKNDQASALAAAPATSTRVPSQTNASQVAVSQPASATTSPAATALKPAAKTASIDMASVPSGHQTTTESQASIRSPAPSDATSSAPAPRVAQTVTQPPASAATESQVQEAKMTEEQRLQQLFSRLSAAYEAEDAGAFAVLFTRNARTTDAQGQREILDLYTDFFANNLADEFRYLNLRWTRQGQSGYSVNAKVAITTRMRDGSGGGQVEADIRFQVEANPQGYLITAMEY